MSQTSGTGGKKRINNLTTLQIDKTPIIIDLGSSGEVDVKVRCNK